MKIILTSNIKKLGKIGDSVNVKDGYARNYLFPQHKALRENKKNLEYYQKIKDEIAQKEKIKKDDANNLIKELKKVKIEFSKEVDEKNQLYGAISKKEIQNYLVEKNIKLILDDILIPEPIKSAGNHIIKVNPYDGIEAEVNIIVKKS